MEDAPAQQQQLNGPLQQQQQQTPQPQTPTCIASPKAMSPCAPSSGSFIPLATWTEPVRRPARTSPSESDGAGDGPGPVCHQEGLAVLHGAQGRCPRILFLGDSNSRAHASNSSSGGISSNSNNGGNSGTSSSGAAGSTEEALQALLGPAAVLPPADAAVLWIWSRLEPLPLPSAPTFPGALPTSVPDRESLILYLCLPSPTLRAPHGGSRPTRDRTTSLPGSLAPLMTPVAGRGLMAAALLIASNIILVDSSSSPSASSSSSSTSPAASSAAASTSPQGSTNRLQQLSIGLADLSINLSTQPLQLLVLIPLPQAKFSVLLASQPDLLASPSSSAYQHLSTSGAQPSGGGGVSAVMAAFEQQQLDQLPEGLAQVLQRQLDLHLGPAPAVAASPSLARQGTIVVSRQPGGGGGATLKAAVQGALVRVLCAGPARGYTGGGASCTVVRGSWLGRLVQVFASRVRGRMGFPTLAECRAEAEAFKAMDAEEEALAAYRRRMTSLDLEAVRTQHAEAVSSACRLFMNMVIEVNNVHSIADSFRALKSKCDEECQLLVQQAEEQRAARQTRLRAGRSYGNLASRHGRLDSTDNAASKTAMSHASSSTDLAGAEAAARQGGASPFKLHLAVEVPSPTASSERTSQHLNTLYAPDEASDGGMSRRPSLYLAADLSSPLGRVSLPLIDRTRLSRGTVQAITGHTCDALCSSAGCTACSLSSPCGASAPSFSLPGSPKCVRRHSTLALIAHSRSRSQCGLPPVSGGHGGEACDAHAQDFMTDSIGGGGCGGSRLGPGRRASSVMSAHELGRGVAAIVASARAEAHGTHSSLHAPARCSALATGLAAAGPHETRHGSHDHTHAVGRDSNHRNSNSYGAGAGAAGSGGSGAVSRESPSGLAGHLGDKLQGLMQDWGVAEPGGSGKGSVLARILVHRVDPKLGSGA